MQAAAAAAAAVLAVSTAHRGGGLFSANRASKGVVVGRARARAPVRALRLDETPNADRVAGDAVDGATGDLSAGSLALFDASLVVGDF